MVRAYTPIRYTRPRFKMPTRGHPVVREFFKIAAEEQTPLTTIAEKAGVSWDNIRAWCNGVWKGKKGASPKHVRTPTLGTIDACLNVLGYKLAVVPIDWPRTRVSFKHDGEIDG